MPKVSKGPPPDELVQLRAALALNLRVLITGKYGSSKAETAVAEEIGRATGLGKNTVLRALGKGTDDNDIRLDTLVRIASHLGVTAMDLLRDYGRAATDTVRKSLRMNDKTTTRARAEGMDAEADRATLQRHRRS